MKNKSAKEVNGNNPPVDGDQFCDDESTGEAVNIEDIVLEEPLVDVITTAATEDGVAKEPTTDRTDQLEKSRDDYLRLAAEFDNYKKRTTREFANLVKTANEGLIVELLDVIDIFERAFKSREENSDPEAYNKGINLLYDKFVETLSREGLQRLEAIGQKFDPRYHEAVVQVDSDDAEPDTVALELQSGYTLNDKVIRHAKVGVVRAKSES